MKKTQTFRELNFVKDKDKSNKYINSLQIELNEKELEICNIADPSAALNIFSAVFNKVTTNFAPMRENTITDLKNRNGSTTS